MFTLVQKIKTYRFVRSDVAVGAGDAPKVGSRDDRSESDKCDGELEHC